MISYSTIEELEKHLSSLTPQQINIRISSIDMMLQDISEAKSSLTIMLSHAKFQEIEAHEMSYPVQDVLMLPDVDPFNQRLFIDSKQPIGIPLEYITPGIMALAKIFPKTQLDLSLGLFFPLGYSFQMQIEQVQFYNLKEKRVVASLMSFLKDLGKPSHLVVYWIQGKETQNPEQYTPHYSCIPLIPMSKKDTDYLTAFLDELLTTILSINGPDDEDCQGLRQMIIKYKEGTKSLREMWLTGTGTFNSAIYEASSAQIGKLKYEQVNVDNFLDRIAANFRSACTSVRSYFDLQMTNLLPPGLTIQTWTEIENACWIRFTSVREIVKSKESLSWESLYFTIADRPVSERLQVADYASAVYPWWPISTPLSTYSALDIMLNTMANRIQGTITPTCKVDVSQGIAANRTSIAGLVFSLNIAQLETIFNENVDKQLELKRSAPIVYEGFHLRSNLDCYDFLRKFIRFSRKIQVAPRIQTFISYCELFSIVKPTIYRNSVQAIQILLSYNLQTIAIVPAILVLLNAISIDQANYLCKSALGVGRATGLVGSLHLRLDTIQFQRNAGPISNPGQVVIENFIQMNNEILKKRQELYDKRPRIYRQIHIRVGELTKQKSIVTGDEEYFFTSQRKVKKGTEHTLAPPGVPDPIEEVPVLTLQTSTKRHYFTADGPAEIGKDRGSGNSTNGGQIPMQYDASNDVSARIFSDPRFKTPLRIVPEEQIPDPSYEATSTFKNEDKTSNRKIRTIDDLRVYVADNLKPARYYTHMEIIWKPKEKFTNQTKTINQKIQLNTGVPDISFNGPNVSIPVAISLPKDLFNVLVSEMVIISDDYGRKYLRGAMTGLHFLVGFTKELHPRDLTDWDNFCRYPITFADSPTFFQTFHSLISTSYHLIGPVYIAKIFNKEFPNGLVIQYQYGVTSEHTLLPPIITNINPSTSIEPQVFNLENYLSYYFFMRSPIDTINHLSTNIEETAFGPFCKSNPSDLDKIILRQCLPTDLIPEITKDGIFVQLQQYRVLITDSSVFYSTEGPLENDGNQIGASSEEILLPTPILSRVTHIQSELTNYKEYQVYPPENNIYPEQLNMLVSQSPDQTFIIPEITADTLSRKITLVVFNREIDELKANLYLNLWYTYNHTSGLTPNIKDKQEIIQFFMPNLDDINVESIAKYDLTKNEEFKIEDIASFFDINLALEKDTIVSRITGLYYVFSECRRKKMTPLMTLALLLSMYCSTIGFTPSLGTITSMHNLYNLEKNLGLNLVYTTRTVDEVQIVHDAIAYFSGAVLSLNPVNKWIITTEIDPANQIPGGNPRDLLIRMNPCFTESERQFEGMQVKPQSIPMRGLGVFSDLLSHARVVIFREHNPTKDQDLPPSLWGIWIQRADQSFIKFNISGDIEVKKRVWNFGEGTLQSMTVLSFLQAANPKFFWGRVHSLFLQVLQYPSQRQTIKLDDCSNYKHFGTFEQTRVKVKQPKPNSIAEKEIIVEDAKICPWDKTYMMYMPPINLQRDSGSVEKVSLNDNLCIKMLLGVFLLSHCYYGIEVKTKSNPLFCQGRLKPTYFAETLGFIYGTRDGPVVSVKFFDDRSISAIAQLCRLVPLRNRANIINSSIWDFSIHDVLKCPKKPKIFDEIHIQNQVKQPIEKDIKQQGEIVVSIFDKNYTPKSDDDLFDFTLDFD